MKNTPHEKDNREKEWDKMDKDKGKGRQEDQNKPLRPDQDQKRRDKGTL